MDQLLLEVFLTVQSFSYLQIGFHFIFIAIVIISLFCIIGKCADLEGLPHFQSKI